MLTHLAQSHRYSHPDLQEPPHRTRLEYQKYMNEINLMLRSLITAGKLKRMELMSINNKALFNRGKVKRCEWMAQRKFVSGNFLPDVRNMSLDYRRDRQQKEGSARAGKKAKAKESNIA